MKNLCNFDPSWKKHLNGAPDRNCIIGSDTCNNIFTHEDILQRSYSAKDILTSQRFCYCPNCGKSTDDIYENFFADELVSALKRLAELEDKLESK